jgi:hypothetical protein
MSYRLGEVHNFINADEPITIISEDKTAACYDHVLKDFLR